jgi:hypothetical protein
MIDRATIQSRRDILAAQIERARLVYADLEVLRDREIAQLADAQRQLCAMAGGLQELDALLAQQQGDGLVAHDVLRS